MPIISYYSGFFIPKILVGNKIDLEASRVISSNDGKSIADKLGLLYIETTVKEGSNIESIINSLLYLMLKTRIINLEKLKDDEHTNYGILTVAPPIIHDYLLNESFDIDQKIKTSKIFELVELERFLEEKVAPAKIVQDFYKIKYDIFDELSHHYEDLQKILSSYLLSGALDLKKYEAVKLFLLKSVSSAEKNFSKQIPHQVELVKISKQWTTLKEEIEAKVRTYGEFSDNILSQIEQMYKDIEEEKQSLLKILSNQVATIHSLIEKKDFKPAQKELEKVKSIKKQHSPFKEKIYS